MGESLTAGTYISQPGASPNIGGHDMATGPHPRGTEQIQCPGVKGIREPHQHSDSAGPGGYCLSCWMIKTGGGFMPIKEEENSG